MTGRAELTAAEARLRARHGPGFDRPDLYGDSLHQVEPVERAQLSRAPGLRAVNIGEFLALDIPPREMVLSPIMQTQALTLLYSKRGVGKTHVGLGIAYAVATGGRFLRWEAPKPRRVLFVDGEMPAQAVQERIASIVAGTDKEPPSPDYLRIITPDIQDGPIPDLSVPENQAALDAMLEGVALLVLDNLSTLCRCGRENEAESWLPVQGWGLALRRHGTSCLFIHHAGKGGAQRGTSRREDVLDTVICLKHPEDYSPTEGARFEVHLEKSRALHGDGAKPFEARLEVRDGAALWTMRDIEDVELARAAELFSEGSTVREVASEMGISKSKAGRLRDAAESR